MEGNDEAMISSNDADLMAQTARGDRKAFGILVDRYKDGLVSYLCHLTGCPEGAEEIAQEAFLKLYRTADRYHEQGKLAAYLFRIATNLVRSARRRELRWSRLAPALSWAAAAGIGFHRPAPPEEAVIQGEIQAVVSQAIAELPLAYREPLVLHEIEGWPYDRIATALSCREGTVKSRVHRARQRLKKKLSPYWNGGRP